MDRRCSCRRSIETSRVAEPVSASALEVACRSASVDPADQDIVDAAQDDVVSLDDFDA